MMMKSLIWPVLGLSLAANLFLGGYVLGRQMAPTEVMPTALPAMDHARPSLQSDRRGDGREPSRILRMDEMLGDADRQILRQSFRASHADMEERGRDMRGTLRHISALVAEDEPDLQAIEAGFRRLARAQNAARESALQGFMQALAQLSPEGRKTLATSPFLLQAVGLPTTKKKRSSHPRPDPHPENGAEEEMDTAE